MHGVSVCAMAIVIVCGAAVPAYGCRIVYPLTLYGSCLTGRACAHVVFFAHRVYIVLWGPSWASPGLLLGLSCVLLGSPGPLLGLSWVSPGPLLGSRDLSHLRKGLFCVANYSTKVATCTRGWFRIAKYSTKCNLLMRAPQHHIFEKKL